MLIAASFIIVETWKQSKCPLTDEQAKCSKNVDYSALELEAWLK
jgi:hypothetical protein